MPPVKRTYGSNRTTRPAIALPSSPRSSYSSDPAGLDETHTSLTSPLRKASFAFESSSPSPPSSPVRPAADSSLGKRKRVVTADGAENVAAGSLKAKVKPSPKPHVSGAAGPGVRVNLLDFLVPKSSTTVKKGLATIPASTPPTKKRALASVASSSSRPTSSSAGKTTSASKTKTKPNAKPGLTQLHLTLGRTSLITCSLCSLSYTRGAPEDEDLHKKHCARISRGAEWGKEEARSEGKEVTVIEEGLRIKGKGKGGGEERGRIVVFNASLGGRVGAKLATLLQTVNVALSAPDLPPELLAKSKAYLFLLSSSSSSSSKEREKIVGCVIAQSIETAMKICASPPTAPKSPTTPPPTHSLTTSTPPPESSPTSLPCVEPDTPSLEPVIVHFSDSSSDPDDTGLFCSPTPLPTPLGIPRMFVSAQHRHKGIAVSLLDAAAKTFIHGCPLDPKLGQVAFSQPTRAGRGVMERWGGGEVRIYEE